MQAEGQAHIPETRMRFRQQQGQVVGQPLVTPPFWPACEAQTNTAATGSVFGGAMDSDTGGGGGVSTALSQQQLAALHLQFSQHAQLLMQVCASSCPICLCLAAPDLP